MDLYDVQMTPVDDLYQTGDRAQSWKRGARGRTAPKVLGMVTCGACGKQVDADFTFCPYCANPMTEGHGDEAVERKVVTILFCDLVGSTAAAEGADPEDVQARLASLHRMLAAVLEGHGGTIQKFAGDAAMAVFGAPVAHEDDPERAVRAGLAILDEAARRNARDPAVNLHLRVGINTGECVIDHAAAPARGDAFVFGDVVNTAARIQSSADVDTVAVGAPTFRATERVFDFEGREPFVAKGKSEPVLTWRVVRARARLGVDVIRDLGTPLVGRDSDVRLLYGAFDKSARERVAQLVTVVGEPGVGKSRLVAELLAYVEARPELVAWRQGRCLPYGDGITYWALGEIVKAHAGIDDMDDADEATQKLRATVPATGDPEGMLARLLPLIGIESGLPAGKEESFRAWLAYIESFAVAGPLVLVVEDVHWADDSLLAFIEYLAEWAQDMPLLIVCTARPELLAKHASWGAGSVSGTTLRLSRLSDEETGELVEALLDGTRLPERARRAVLDRAGGNPLYAEEFVRMLRDRGLLEDDGGLGDDPDMPLPDGVQALIAARLDVAAPTEKDLLLTAAVIGKVFSPEAVAGLLGRPAEDLAADLHALTRKEFIRPQRRTIGQGGFDYSFWHVLIRDVAYGALPRQQRARLHAAFLEWTERTAADRLEDAAEILAHHAQEALSLAVALGDGELAAEMSESARRWNLLAGERAFGLDTRAAVRYLSAAVALTPDAHPERLATMALYGSALFDARREGEALDVLRPVLALVDADPTLADDQRVAESVIDMWNAAQAVGRFDLLPVLSALIDRAEERLPEGPARTFLSSFRVNVMLLYGSEEDVRTAVAEADAVCEVAGRGGWRFRFADVTAAIGRSFLGDEDEYLQLEPRAERARRVERPTFVAFSYGWQAGADSHWRGPLAAMDRLDQGLRYADERRLNAFVALGPERLVERLRSGDVAGAQADAGELNARGLEGTWTASEQLWLGLETGYVPSEVLGAAQRLVDDPDAPAVWKAPILVLLARSAVERGDIASGRDVIDRIGLDELLGNCWLQGMIPMLGRVLLAIGDHDRLRFARDHARQYTPLDVLNHGTLSAQLAESEGRLVEAAAAYDALATEWSDFDCHLEATYALLGRGRCLSAAGEASGASVTAEAERGFSEMGALGLGRW